jgi:uncharacterized RDD family membrane protein YckC
MEMDTMSDDVEPRGPGPSGAGWRVATTTARTVAALVDLIPLALISGALSLSLVTSPAGEGTPSPFNAVDRLVDLVNASPEVVAVPASLLTALFVLWSVATTWRLGATPGQRLVGLKARTRGGEPLSLARSLSHAILAVVTTALMGLGPLWSLADPERRTLYDRLAGVVLRTDR